MATPYQNYPWDQGRDTTNGQVAQLRDSLMRMGEFRKNPKLVKDELDHRQALQLMEREYEFKRQMEELEREGRFQYLDRQTDEQMEMVTFKDNPQGYWDRKRTEYQLQEAQIQEDYDRGLLSEQERDMGMSQVNQKIKALPQTRQPTTKELVEKNTYWMETPSGKRVLMTMDKGVPQVVRGFDEDENQGYKPPKPEQVLKDYDELYQKAVEDFQKMRDELVNQMTEATDDLQSVLMDSEAIDTSDDKKLAENSGRLRSLRQRRDQVQRRVDSIQEKMSSLKAPTEDDILEAIAQKYERQQKIFERIYGSQRPSPSDMQGVPQRPPMGNGASARAGQPSMGGQPQMDVPSDEELAAQGITLDEIEELGRRDGEAAAQRIMEQRMQQQVSEPSPAERQPSQPPSVAGKVQRTVRGPEAAKVLSQLPPQAQEQIRVLTRKLETATNQSAREIARRDLIKLLLELGLVTDADANATAAGPTQ